ncbi:MAG: serine/threonine protein kinase [Silvibacterium sp.]|nr:serine/threonine protein kinase [Silvibacterium sp.]
MASGLKLTERWFEAALALKTTERSAFLDEACNGDGELRHRVEDLLAQDERAGSFLLHSPLDLLCGAAGDGAPIGEKAHPMEECNSSSFHELEGRLFPGQVLNDRFVIIRFIARGGMGEVYEAEDRFLQGAHIALKTILPHFAGDTDLQRCFEREVVLAREVIHPNLCPIYDIFHCDEGQPGFLFLTMKLLKGETLAARLKRVGATPTDEAMAVLSQLLAGLAAVHAANIIHGDIKPNNIVLNGTGPDVRLFITDFGLACVSGSETTICGKAIAGTPHYMAPELFFGQPPEQASDLFALGVLLHEVFTGQKPAITRDSYSVSIHPHLNSSRMPLSCVHLVTQLLDRNPKRRCEAFEHALGWISLDFVRGCRTTAPRSKRSLCRYGSRRSLYGRCGRMSGLGSVREHASSLAPRQFFCVVELAEDK